MLIQIFRTGFLPGIGGDDIWLNLSPSNNIKFEYKYSITQSISSAEMYLYLIDTTCCNWLIDSVKIFSTSQQQKSITYNPNNSNKKKMRLNIHFDNTGADTVFIKFDNFKVSKLN